MRTIIQRALLMTVASLTLSACFDWDDLNAYDGPDDNDSNTPLSLSTFNPEHWSQCVKNQAHITGWPEGVEDYCYKVHASAASSNERDTYWCTSGFDEMIQSALHECCSENRGQFYEVRLLNNPNPVGCWKDNEQDPAKRLIKGQKEADCLNEGGIVVYQRPAVYVSEDYGVCRDPNPPLPENSGSK